MERSTTTLEFGRNFIPLSIAALRGTRSQTIFPSIPNGELNRRSQLTTLILRDISVIRG